MMGLTITFLVVTLVASFLDTTQACVCFEQTVKEYYCRSKQVMKISISGDPEVVVIPHDKTAPMHAASDDELANHFLYQGQLYLKYTYRLRRLYKGVRPSTNFAYTKYHSNMCGGKLTPGRSIVMGHMGEVREEEAFVFEMCNYAENVSKIPKADLKFLRGKNIDCEGV